MNTLAQTIAYKQAKQYIQALVEYHEAIQANNSGEKHVPNTPNLAQIRIIEDIIERLGEIMRPDPVLPIGPRIIFTTDTKQNDTLAQEFVKDWAVSVLVGPVQENTVKETVMK